LHDVAPPVRRTRTPLDPAVPLHAVEDPLEGRRLDAQAARELGLAHPLLEDEARDDLPLAHGDAQGDQLLVERTLDGVRGGDDPVAEALLEIVAGAHFVSMLTIGCGPSTPRVREAPKPFRFGHAVGLCRMCRLLPLLLLLAACSGGGDASGADLSGFETARIMVNTNHRGAHVLFSLEAGNEVGINELGIQPRDLALKRLDPVFQGIEPHRAGRPEDQSDSHRRKYNYCCQYNCCLVHL